MVLAERETLVRDGLHGLLEGDSRVVASVADLDALLSEVGRLQPAVVVACLELLLARGAAGVRALRAVGSPARLVVVAREPQAAVPESDRLGAAGWVLRSSPASELRLAVRAAAGAPLEAPSARPARVERVAASRVTPRAAEVVRLIAHGKVMKEVARDLGISVRTVAFHKYKTMRDLGLDSTAALVRYAVANRML